MQAVWNSLQKKDYENLRPDVLDAHDTCFTENNICSALLQNSTYIETLFLVIRQAGPLSAAVFSQV